jgi:hypothetical protein
MVKFIGAVQNTGAFPGVPDLMPGRNTVDAMKGLGESPQVIAAMHTLKLDVDGAASPYHPPAPQEALKVIRDTSGTYVNVAQNSPQIAQVMDTGAPRAKGLAM